MFFIYYVFRNMLLNYIGNNGIDLNVEASWGHKILLLQVMRTSEPIQNHSLCLLTCVVKIS